MANSNEFCMIQTRISGGQMAKETRLDVLIVLFAAAMITLFFFLNALFSNWADN